MCIYTIYMYISLTLFVIILYIILKMYYTPYAIQSLNSFKCYIFIILLYEITCIIITTTTTTTT